MAFLLALRCCPFVTVPLLLSLCYCPFVTVTLAIDPSLLSHSTLAHHATYRATVNKYFYLSEKMWDCVHVHDLIISEASECNDNISSDCIPLLLSLFMGVIQKSVIDFFIVYRLWWEDTIVMYLCHLQHITCTLNITSTWTCYVAYMTSWCWTLLIRMD